MFPLSANSFICETIKLFLGTVIRIGSVDSHPDVLKELLKHELALRGCLHSLNVPSLENMVNLNLEKLDLFKAFIENDPDALKTAWMERQDSMEESSESEYNWSHVL